MTKIKRWLQTWTKTKLKTFMPFFSNYCSICRISRCSVFYEQLMHFALIWHLTQRADNFTLRLVIYHTDLIPSACRWPALCLFTAVLKSWPFQSAVLLSCHCFSEFLLWIQKLRSSFFPLFSQLLDPYSKSSYSSSFALYPFSCYTFWNKIVHVFILAPQHCNIRWFLWIWCHSSVENII